MPKGAKPRPELTSKAARLAGYDGSHTHIVVHKLAREGCFHGIHVVDTNVDLQMVNGSKDAFVFYPGYGHNVMLWAYEKGFCVKFSDSELETFTQ